MTPANQPPEFPPPTPPALPVPPTGTAVPEGRVPFHPAASGLLLVVDNLWNFADFAVIDWFLTIPGSFLSVFGPVYWIQRRKHLDRVPVALAKALFLGIVAAVPFSVTGTPVGLGLLAWAGVKHPWKRSEGSRQQPF